MPSYSSIFFINQAGIQFEYLTGGEVLCGYHEVIYTDELKEIVKRQTEEKSKDTYWRVSSTLFSHIRQNVVLSPLEQFVKKNPSLSKKYPPILTRDQVANELKEISLMA